jgi:hypothetical protein
LFCGGGGVGEKLRVCSIRSRVRKGRVYEKIINGFEKDRREAYPLILSISDEVSSSSVHLFCN